MDVSGYWATSENLEALDPATSWANSVQAAQQAGRAEQAAGGPAERQAQAEAAAPN
jgi:hypothetical protein